MTSKYLETRRGRMHYIDEGPPSPQASADRTLLFVHGTPTHSYEYRHLIASLSQTHRCIAPDHLGFGRSDRPTAFPYTPEAHAEVLREFVAALGLESFALVVHDFGGPIGLPLAMSEGLSGPDRTIPSRMVDRVILMNTWAWPLNDDHKM